MLHFVVNIRDRKSCEQRNTQRSSPECNTERQRNEKHVRERKKHHKGQKVCVCMCVFSCSITSDCDPMDCSPPGSSVYGILQARI